MAEHLAASASYIKLRLGDNCVWKRGYLCRNPHLRIAKRNACCGSNHLGFSMAKMCKRSAPGVTKLKANSFPKEPSNKCTCLASLADFDGIAASGLLPMGDQVLLMTSIFLTYMAGVIPAGKSVPSSTKNVYGKIPVTERPEASGSAGGTDCKGDLKYAWDVVRRKLLDSIDAAEHGNCYGTRVLQTEQTRRSPPLSLYALSHESKLWLLWSCFQQLEEEANNISSAVKIGDWNTIFREVIRKSCQPACMAWLKKEFGLDNKNFDKAIASLVTGKVKGDDTILQNITKSGKEDLYAEFLCFHVFQSQRKSSYYDSSLFQLHGVSILEDLVITLADGIACLYLELTSVDGNVSSDMSGMGLHICNLSTRALQRLRNEVALYQWLYQNLEAVVSMYEDRFDLHTFQSQVINKTSSEGVENSKWWKKITLGMYEAESSPLRYVVISHFSMPVKRTRELRALTGWRYYFSLFLELSDISMPIIRIALDKVSSAISFFLVTLIGRSLGLIYTGIRESLRWK